MNDKEISPPFEAYKGSEAFIFISYSHQDKKDVYSEIKSWHSAGIRIWYDEGISLGKVWTQEIANAIKNCALVVVFISSNSIKSRNVENEINFAVDNGKEILAIYLEETELPSGIKLRIGDVQGLLKYNYPDEYYQGKIRQVLGVGKNTKQINADTDVNDIPSIIFDNSYRQSRWRGCPTANIGFSDIANELSKSFTIESYSQGYTSRINFPKDSILVFPTPFGSKISDFEYDRIFEWVQNGGKLLTFGTYLMEEHHFNNFNNLIRRFGLELQRDLIMPIGKENYFDCMHQAFEFQNRELWIISKLRVVPENHQILDGINQIAITSSCTVRSAARPSFIVSTSEPVANMNAIGYQEPGGRLIRITDYILDKHEPATVMVGQIYGKGKIIVIGSWKVFLNDLVQAYPDGNLQLFLNVISWLGEK